MTDANRLSGGTRVGEALSASSALAGASAPPPLDAFERGFSQRHLYRDTDLPASQSRPWLLWFLVITLSGGIAATVFWSDISISRDGAPQSVGSDSAWRGVIRQPRPDRSALAPGLAHAVNKSPPVAGASPIIKPGTRLAAYSAANESARVLPSRRAEAPGQPRADLLGDPTVLSIQGLLSKRGFDPGPVDGLSGKRTQAAILAWQVQQGLPTTGRPSKQVLEQLLDPTKVSGAVDRPSFDSLAKAERDILEAWCPAGGTAANRIAQYECIGDELKKLKNGLRMPQLANQASGKFDALATAQLLCTDLTDAAPQAYFECLHTNLDEDKAFLVME